MWILTLQILGIATSLAFVLPVILGFWVWWAFFLEDWFRRRITKINTYVK